MTQKNLELEQAETIIQDLNAKLKDKAAELEV